MTESIKLRTRQAADFIELKLLIRHPMENGRNRTPETQALIPAHHIEDIDISLNGRVILSMQMAGSVSRDPFFIVRLTRAKSGDRITVEWRDNHGVADRADLMIE